MKYFIIDVDGTLTNGKFFYDEKGKILKAFGPDDHDALNLIKDYIKIIFISGDKKGFAISKKRIVDHMNFDLFLVSTYKRIDWIRERFDPTYVIYMGDGIFDYRVMREVGYGISTFDGDPKTKKFSNFITYRKGGERAVAEAAVHISKKFLKLKL